MRESGESDCTVSAGCPGRRYRADPVVPGHLGRIELEALDVTAGLEAIEVRRLGDHDDPVLDVPPDHDLGRRHAVSVRELDERGVPE